MTHCRLTPEGFPRTAEAGVLPEDLRPGLGEMNPIRPKLAAAMRPPTARFAPLAARGEAPLSAQNPLVAAGSGPYPNRTLLMAEGVGTPLCPDPTPKFPRYAQAGAPKAWAVDLEGRRALLHRRPEGGACWEGENQPPLRVEIPTEELL
ncbi:Uma2 family endonuclease [Thermus thalpophilus]|uniref:Uma2 family endonuclease n=1 Tax=Thermus thalpophilus TaxID=2908147 RepID=UPI001FAB2CF8|nr:Uma2 family endonuclease [Thermus thalpophilus]